MDNPAVLNITVDVEAYRKLAGVSINGLANATGIPYSSLRLRLEHPGRFTLDQLNLVATVIKLPAEAFEVAA